jgi:hypothetical protein
LNFIYRNTLLLEVKTAEAEFLDVIGTKIIRIFLLAIHSFLYQQRRPVLHATCIVSLKRQVGERARTVVRSKLANGNIRFIKIFT